MITQSDGTVKYEGQVLKTWTDNSYRIMSDVWGVAEMALVWNGERPETIVTHVYWEEGKKAPLVTVDATPEVIEKYRQFVFKNKIDELKGRVIAESKQPKEGRTVKVVKGKNAKGKVGEVFKQITRPYNMGWKSVNKLKLGIKYDDEITQVAGPNGKVWNNFKNADWVWASNVEVINPEQYQDFTGIEEIAEYHTKQVMENKYG